jgi:hypothetical protein
MNRSFLFLILTLFIACSLPAQKKVHEKDIIPEEIFEKPSGIPDRAGGIHNASNIGLFFENRGKLYPRRITQGPSGEFPINSTKHYIYRINPWVGVPGNVIQGRYTDNEEWEAAFGYHNRDSAKIAFSDNEYTWPSSGWPVKDANGSPVFKSDQDSYCVYNDSNNTVQILGITVAQTGYAYGVDFAKNILFFKYEIINNGQNDLDSLYFGLYQDIDVGNVSGGDPEYADDRLGFDKSRNLLYHFDDGKSDEWPDGTTGFFGVTFVHTPDINGVEAGITDWHYNAYDDDVDIDSIQYGIMSSAPGLYNSSIGSRYFHTGTQQIARFDDVNTIPAGGADIVPTASSGPYVLNAGDTLTFITAIVAGETRDEILSAADQARTTYEFDFELAKPPARPVLTGIAGNKKAVLFWDDKSEQSLDAFTNEYDFAGYRLYRSDDKGINWERLRDFSISDLQYTYTDTAIVNGFEYWYSVTAYDRGGGGISSLESPVGNTLEAVNTISLTPYSAASGRTPVSADAANKIYGSSNYLLNVQPLDFESLAGNEYITGFTFTSQKISGNLKTSVGVNITDSARTKPYRYEIVFTSAGSFDIYNLTTDEVIREGYTYNEGGRSVAVTGHGITINMSDAAGTETDYRPQAGDKIDISFSLYTTKNGISDTVISPRPVSVGQAQVTNDGVIFSLVEPEVINSVSRVGGSDNIEMEFSVSDASLVKDNTYLVTTEGRGTEGGEGYIIITVKDAGLLLTDTLFNGDTFIFDGIEGTAVFPSENPPQAGNIFSVITVKPVEPNVQDMYMFSIKGSSVNTEVINSSMNKIRVVPNPYIASSLWEPEFGELRREPLRQIQFVNLPPECTIHIFSIDADRVKTIEHNSTNGTELWDLRSESGREVAPGIYIYVVKTASAEYMERFAIIK